MQLAVQEQLAVTVEKFSRIRGQLEDTSRAARSDSREDNNLICRQLERQELALFLPFFFSPYKNSQILLHPEAST